jgi:predicted Zn-dependent protease
MKRIIYFGIALLASTFIFYACSRNPVTGKKELSLMSSAQEQQAGDQADPSIQASYGMYDDAKLQSFINQKGKAMGKISHLPDQEYNFRLLDSPVVNAFAVPGGYVYFTRGIMAHFNNEAEFAGVLGHEIGHITARHSARQQTRQTLGQLGFMVGVIASEKFRVFANEAGQGLGLLFLKFGRDQESQSDELGVRYSSLIGYDSHEMADFFQTLNRLSTRAGQSIPDFLSTHPNPVNRYAKVHQMSDEIQSELGLRNLKVNRNEYLRRIDGLVYGEDPRQGYAEDGYFFHPELRFAFPVPYNWQLVNSPQQVQMAPEDGKALMIFTLSPERTLDAAAQAAVQQFNLTVVEQQRTTVNGYSALVVVSDQVPDQAQQGGQAAPTTRIVSYFIEKDNNIYIFHGVSAQADFNNYLDSFRRTATGFENLTETSRLNVEPIRIKVQSVKNGATLSQALASLGASNADLEELAIVNGMELGDRVEAGMLLKTFSSTYTKQQATVPAGNDSRSTDNNARTTTDSRNTNTNTNTNTQRPTNTTRPASRKTIKRKGGE